LTDAPREARPVRAIAFDWGGVFTVGTFDARAVRALATLYRLDERTVSARYYPLMEEFEVGAFDLPGFKARLEAALAGTDAASHPVDADLAAFRSAFLDAPVERPAMYALLAAVPRGYTVGMLSNNVPELCDRVRGDPRMARVERFVFSNEIGARKPDPAAFAALSAALAVPPGDTVFVDDSEANIAACTELGYRGLLLDSEAEFGTRWRRALPELAHLLDGSGWTS
jgi:putative hydrolase of the HAD superfamily